MIDVKYPNAKLQIKAASKENIFVILMMRVDAKSYP